MIAMLVAKLIQLFVKRADSLAVANAATRIASLGPHNKIVRKTKVSETVIAPVDTPGMGEVVIQVPRTTKAASASQRGSNGACMTCLVASATTPAPEATTSSLHIE